MSRSVAILGLGRTGTAWARAFHATGWSVRLFDPDDRPDAALPKGAGVRRCDRISAAVRDVAWIVVALPERLELQQKVIQRAQAEAPAGAVVIATARGFSLDDVQACAARPERVVMLRRERPSTGPVLHLTPRNEASLRDEVLALLSEIETDLMAALPDPEAGEDPGAAALSA